MMSTGTLSTVLTPRRNEQGWVIEITDETAEAIGLVPGSQVMLYEKDGVINTEILPPLSPELASIADEVFQDNLAVFQELKRLGD